MYEKWPLSCFDNSLSSVNQNLLKTFRLASGESSSDLPDVAGELAISTLSTIISKKEVFDFRQNSFSMKNLDYYPLLLKLQRWYIVFLP